MSKKIIGYLRVSTEEQRKSGLGLEAQRVAIQRWAVERGYDIVHFFEEDISGGKPLHERMMLQTAMKLAAKVGATIVVSRLDRLSRNALILMSLNECKVPFVALNLGEDVDKFMFNIYAVVAEQERVVIRQRTREALSVLKAQGKRLGNPNAVDRVDENGNVVRGYKTCTALGRERIAANADEFATKMKPTLQRMIDAGMSLRGIAEELNKMKTPTARGGEWQATTVRNVIARWAA